MVKKINSAEFDVTKNGLCVIDFSAEWCGPCKMVAPIMEELSEEMSGKMDFYNIDVDDNPDIAQMFRVASIPTLVVMKDGNILDQQIGFLPKEPLAGFLNRFI